MNLSRRWCYAYTQCKRVIPLYLIRQAIFYYQEILKVSFGAGFIVAIIGDIMTMLRLLHKSAVEKIDIENSAEFQSCFNLGHHL